MVHANHAVSAAGDSGRVGFAHFDKQDSDMRGTVCLRLGVCKEASRLKLEKIPNK
jgi:hypothetical protein